MRTLNWAEAAQHCQSAGESFVLITVLGAAGSTPRDSGTKMVITGESSWDTIGGGQLEFSIITHARQLLLQPKAAQEIHHFPLGASLGQCCGGSVTVLFEQFPSAFPVVVFGAGHVAQALIRIMAELPCRVHWIDNRAGQFPEPLPPNVVPILADQPAEEVPQLSPGSHVLVLTQNHQLDYDICLRVLNRDDLPYLGLIGSHTKAQRFRQRLTHRGYSESALQRLECPAGLSEVPGKHPMEVAVSLAGRLIALRQAQQPDTPARTGISWKTLKQRFQQPIDTHGTGYRLSITDPKES